MNYARHYQTLIERAEDRVLDVYTEKHHVLPRCLDKDSTHVVRLTPEEHYVAHQLLVKMNPGNQKLLWAASNMTGSTRNHRGRKNKLFGWLRRALSESLKGNIYGQGVPHSEESRQRHNASMLGNLFAKGHKPSAEVIAKKREFANSPEFMAKNRAKSLGSVTPLEVREKQKASCTAAWADPQLRAEQSVRLMGHAVSDKTLAALAEMNRTRVLSDETRARMSASAKLRRASDETRAKMSASIRRVKAEQRAARLAQVEARA